LTDLARELAEVPGCVAVILYGSAARGELRKDSDIDVLALFDVERRPEHGPESEEVSRRSVMVQARHDVPWAVSCVLNRAGLEGLDPDYLAWIAAEGIVLWARTDYLIRLASGNERLEPYLLIAYDQTPLSDADRVRLHRALFGYQTSKRVGEKTYKSEHEGVVQFPGQRVGPGVLLVPAHQERAIAAVLDRQGVTYGRTPLWR